MAFEQRFVPDVEHLPAYFHNILIPGGWSGGGGGMGTAGID